MVEFLEPPDRKFIEMQVLKEGGMVAESNDLLDYFRDVVLVTAARPQSWTEKVEAKEDRIPESTCDDFGNELLEWITGMSHQEVRIYYICECALILT